MTRKKTKKIRNNEGKKRAQIQKKENLVEAIRNNVGNESGKQIPTHEKTKYSSS